MPITRQSYFLPTQISNCSLWLDAADSSTVTGTTTVTAWTDKSGSGNHAAFDANKPSYTPANKYIETTNNNTHIRLPSAAFTNTTSQTCIIFIIYADKQEGNNNQALFSTLDYGLYQLLRGPTYAPYNIRGNITVDASYTAFKTSLMTTNTVLYSIQYTAGITGADNYAVAPFGNYWHPISQNYQYITSDIYLGGVSNFDNSGDFHANLKINEVIAYNNIVLTAPQRQQVESYLAQKWGLTASLIGGHPGLNKIIHRNLQTTFTKTPYFVKFSPTQIVGCTHWFDATDSSTITLSSGSLTQWNDKSGNGRNLTAVSGFANATVSSAYQNGLNVFNFSGNGLYRTAAGNVSYPLDVYIIVALKSLTTHVDVLGMGDTSVDNFNSLTFAESAASRWHNGSSGGGRQTISTSDETSLSFLLIQWSLANSNYLLRRNGTQLIQASRTYSFNNSATSIFQIGFRHTDNVYGTQANFRGYIGEIIVFNNQIGTTDRQRVESYLSQKWGLVSSLPAGHLNATFPAGSPTAIQAFIPSIRPAVSSVPFIGGGSASSSGIFSIRTFLTTGQLILSKHISATILVVGGGGGGGSAGVQTGGGGAGGAVFVSSPVTITAGIYTVTVGTGGGINTNGTNSTFLSYTGVGGGGGGNWINGAGKTGGCGGGGSGEGGSGAAGSQGFGGANGRGQFTCGGGGGGMGQAGKQPADGSPSSGGNGLQYSITGSSVYYAGGGAGGFNGASTGGLGGGGDKTLQGTDGLGGGGGSGARGGNGVVIVSFVFL